MTAWSWAEIDGQGGSTTSDRKYADGMSRRMAQSRNSGGSAYADHYAEKAAAREREKRTAAGIREWDESARERDERAMKLLTFRADDPEPWPFGLPSPDDPDHDIFEASEEQQAWEKRRDKYLQRAEGEELAARISRR
ncbi:hypothetical protein ACX6XY_29880 [Streptomyces sp. O3]